MATKKKAPPGRYAQVRVNRVLLWPEEVMPEFLERVWARAGEVLDLSDEALWSWTDGQRHKLVEIEAKTGSDLAEFGTVWSEDMASDQILRCLRKAREKLESETVGARGDDEHAGTPTPMVAAPLPTDDEPQAAPRRAADVEAALAAEE